MSYSEYVDQGWVTRNGIYWRESMMQTSEQWYSSENGVAIGTVRMIDKQLYHAWTIRRQLFAKDRVLWGPVYRNAAGKDKPD